MKYLLLALFFVASASHAALNRTHPLSATTNLRLETYVDEASTIANSTWTIVPSTWTYFGSTRTYTNGNHYIFGSIYVMDGSSWTVRQTSWTFQAYMEMVLDEAKNVWINESMEKDMEQYLVFPSSYVPLSAQPWKGWCLNIINGVMVPVSCP